MIDWECPSCGEYGEHEQESYFDGDLIEATCDGCGAALHVHVRADEEHGVSVGTVVIAEVEGE